MDATIALQSPATLFRMRPLFLVVLAGIVLAQGSKPRGKPHKEPNIYVQEAHYTYSGAYAKIETIDWKNFDYRLKELDRPIPLRAERYKSVKRNEHEEYVGSYEATFKGVQYIGDSPAYAVVQLDQTSCGANCTDWPSIFVFRLEDQRLTVLQYITAEVHHTNGGINFDPQTMLLSVRATNYGAGAHCCPEYIDKVTYRWAGKRFAQVSRMTIPNPDSH